MPVNEMIKLDYTEGTILYFCGVSSPYRWENNLHLAGIVKPNHSSEIEAFNGDKLIVNGLERLTFDDTIAKEKYPNLGKEFLTCRNFQFGCHYF
jgi:hypothetical protein